MGIYAIELSREIPHIGCDYNYVQAGSAKSILKMH